MNNLLGKIGQEDTGEGIADDLGPDLAPETDTPADITSPVTGKTKLGNTWGTYQYAYTGNEEGEIVAADDNLLVIFPSDMAKPSDKMGHFLIGLNLVKESKLTSHKDFKKVNFAS